MELLENAYSLDTAYKAENYPYGFRLKTTKHYYVEHNPKKGYCSVTITVNPKNWKLNAPKKSTYSTFIRMFKNEDWHIKFYNYNTYNIKWLKKAIDDNIFDSTFDIEQEKKMLTALTIRSMTVYWGYDFEKIKNLTLEQLDNIESLEKEKQDEYKTEEWKNPNYSPFKATCHTFNN